MFEQTFKNIDDILHKDAGCSSELDYVEQTSWILFLKYLEDFEKDRKTSAELSGKAYAGIISPEYKWETWAAPKGKDGKIDHHRALTGDDLKDFVDHKLFPYLKKFKADAENADTIEYKIGEIFSELKNKIQSGYNLREVLNRIDELRFRSHAEKHEMSHLYEDKIKNMGNAGRNGGEYYTPRPLIKTIVKVVAPAIGNRIYDGAVGSAGFLVEAFEYLKASKNLSTGDAATLQKKTFYGKEKKSLAYIIGTMNMILHGIEAPNIVHTNTLAENLADIQEKDRYDIVLANPPFGGKERAEVQQNFPIKTGETAFLFLQHFLKILKAGGRAGVVIKNTFLSNSDNASVSLRKSLLESADLHTVLDLPGGTFTGAGVKTVVLFFEKGAPTKKVWFYQLNLDRNLGKTNPLNENDLADFLRLQKTKADSENSWTVNIADVDKTTYDLSVKNPHKKDEAALRTPQEILDAITALDNESVTILNTIREFESYLQSIFANPGEGWVETALGDICKFVRGPFGGSLKKSIFVADGYAVYEQQHAIYDQFDDVRYFINEAKFKEMERFELLPNDLIMSCSGTMGRVAIVPRDIKRGIINQALLKLTPTKKILNTFLKYWMESEAFRNALKQYSGGAAIQNVASVKILKEIRVPLPSVEQQKRVVDALDTLRKETQRLEAICQQKLDNLASLKQSILQKAFEGGHTASQPITQSMAQA